METPKNKEKTHVNLPGATPWNILWQRENCSENPAKKRGVSKLKKTETQKDKKKRYKGRNFH